MKLKTLTTIEDFEHLKKGQVIYVSNGEKEPPKHHTRKHKTWSFRNYRGYVYRFGYSGGRYEIGIDESRSGILVKVYGITDLTFQIEAE